jgi:hypothetical protein
MGAEAASWLSQAAGLTAAQLEFLAPYPASLLARPLASSTLYLDRPRVRKFNADTLVVKYNTRLKKHII